MVSVTFLGGGYIGISDLRWHCWESGTHPRPELPRGPPTASLRRNSKVQRLHADFPVLKRPSTAFKFPVFFQTFFQRRERAWESMEKQGEHG